MYYILQGCNINAFVFIEDLEWCVIMRSTPQLTSKTNILVFCCWQKWLFTDTYFKRKSNIVNISGIHFQSDQWWHEPRKLQYFCHLSIISIVLYHNQVFWLKQLWFFLYCGGYVCSIMTNVAHLCPCVYSDLWPDLVPASYCLTVRLLG